MRFCIECGAKVKEVAKFCPKCGAELDKDVLDIVPGAGVVLGIGANAAGSGTSTGAAGVGSGTSAGAAGVGSGTSAGAAGVGSGTSAGAAGVGSGTSAGAAGVGSGTSASTTAASTGGTFASLGAGAKTAIIVGAAVVVAAVGIGVGAIINSNEAAPTPNDPSIVQPQEPSSQTPTDTPDTLTPIPDPTPEPSIIDDRERDYEVIEFGGYVWRVLEVQDGKAFIISEDVLEDRIYHDSPGKDAIIDNDGNRTWTYPDGWWEYSVTWATSDMRAYLNGEFYNSFSEADKARIADTNVVNNDNPWTFSNWTWSDDNTPGGADTTDKIFLLSLDEAVRYFGDSGMLARGIDENARDENLEWPNHGIYYYGFYDEYSENRRAYHIGGTHTDPWGDEYTIREGTPSWWWLRSPGYDPGGAAYVHFDGGVYVYGTDFYVWGYPIDSVLTFGGVRPALWINLES